MDVATMALRGSGKRIARSASGTSWCSLANLPSATGVPCISSRSPALNRMVLTRLNVRLPWRDTASTLIAKRSLSMLPPDERPISEEPGNTASSCKAIGSPESSPVCSSAESAVTA